MAVVPNFVAPESNVAMEDGVMSSFAEVISDDDGVNTEETVDTAESSEDMRYPKLNIVILPQEGASFFPELSKSIAVPSPRQSESVRFTPKGQSNYTEGKDLDKLLGVAKSTSPKESKRRRIQAKYGK